MAGRRGLGRPGGTSRLLIARRRSAEAYLTTDPQDVSPLERAALERAASFAERAMGEMDGTFPTRHELGNGEG